MITKGHSYPTRVTCRFQGKQGQVVLNQSRTVDKAAQACVLRVLGEMLAE